MIPDIPLLRKVVEWAEAEAAKPEIESQWCQEFYEVAGHEIDRSCGTAYCIAGYVIEISGGLDRDRYVSYPQQAAALLGIPQSEHDACEGLFNANNTIEDVRRIAEEIAAEAGERL